MQHQQLAPLFCPKQAFPLKWRIFQNSSKCTISAFFLVFQNFIDINSNLPRINAIFQRINNIQDQPTKHRTKTLLPGDLQRLATSFVAASGLWRTVCTTLK
ncbi:MULTISPECIES: ABC transporter [Comamonas]|uniref:ABC transporter n=1 Tax=Comamonas TaxID=283 RepID=UPI002110FA1D|nr:MULTISPECIES: ABC transporter [Comamonas]UUC93083.1 ABC transporter [Comamonas sp. C11]WEE77015.1 ABC transporter [Comamonas testosteroni]